MKSLNVKTIVAIGIGSALFFLLGRFVSFPVFANTYVNFQYAVLGFFAVVYGPLAGLLIGLIGHSLIDLTFGSLWWSWIIATMFVGFATGFLCKGIPVESGELGLKGVARFSFTSIVVHAIAWIGIAPALDILIYSEPSDKIFTQGAIAATVNVLTTVVIGSLLLLAYSKTRTQKGSLSKD